LSLCCLFQRGRCSLQERCHQIHVDTQYMIAVRQQNAHVVSCCRRCKDTASLTTSAVSFFATYFDASRQTITVNVAPNCDRKVNIDLLAFTTGLENWLCDDVKGNASAVVPTRKVCRLHLDSRCKYGKDCKYIHLCSTLGESFLSADKPAPRVKTAEVPMVAKSPAFHQPKVQEPPKNAFFDRVKAAPKVEFSRSTSDSLPGASINTSVEDTPKSTYFTVDRFAAPPAAAVASVGNERSLSTMFPKSNNSSCLERSIALTGLCFDPSMLWDCSDDLPSAKKNSDMFGASCEMLSTTCSEAASMASTRKNGCAFA